MIKNITAVLALIIVAVGGALIIQKGGENLSQIPVSSQLAQVPTTGQVGYWNFDDGSAVGKVGNAKDFSNTSFNTGSDSIGSSAATVCAWIHPRSATSYTPNIVSNGTFSAYIFGSSPTFSLGASSNGGAKYPSVGGITANAWNHICVARTSSGSATFYINGSAKTTADSGTPMAGYNSVYVGNNAQGNQAFDGLIDEVRIYNAALSAADVASIYNYKGVVAPSSYTLTVTKNNGTITSTPAGLDCAGGNACTQTVKAGSQVTLNAVLPAGGTITWGGACSGNSLSCTVTVNANTTVTANFGTGITLPVISGVTSSGVTASTATVSWSSNVSVTSQVIYGVSTGYGSHTASTTANTATLSGLQANTMYHYKVVSADASGNVAVSGDNTFTTSAGTTDTTGPTAPATVSATAVSSSQVNITWSASTDVVVPGYPTSGLAGYKVYRNSTLVGTVTGTSYSDTGLSPATAYSYAVTAYDAVGNISPRGTGSRVTTPSGVSGKFSVGQKVVATSAINVRNAANSDVRTNIISTQASSTTGTIQACPSGSTCPVTDSNGTKWWYVSYDVTTDNNVGWSTEPYLAAYTAPNTYTISKTTTGTGTGTVACTPANCVVNAGSSIKLTATPGTNSTFTIWSTNTGCVNTNPCTFTPSGNTTVNATFTAGTFTDTEAPTVPTNLTATVMSANQINLTWTASTDNVAVKGYYVYRADPTSPTNFINIANITNPAATSFSNMGLTANTAYSYKVAAYDTAASPNISAQSAAVSKTTTGVTSYEIKAVANVNGVISPTGIVSVVSGATQKFTITPNSGYGIATLLVDGTAVTLPSPSTYTYTFTNITVGHTITATFVKLVGFPKATLSANPTNITSAGQPVTLTWGSTDASYCTGTGFSTNIGANLSAISGSVTVNPTTNPTNYSVQCTNASGSEFGSAGAQVTIGSDPTTSTSFPPIADRVVDFTTAGVPGGIPNRTQSCGTISASPGSNITSQLQTMINNCPEGQVVNIPEGTFTISSQAGTTVGVYVKKNNITIRGAGANKTILQTTATPSFVLGGFEWTVPSTRVMNGVSGFTKNSRSIKVDSIGAGLAVGQLVLIDQLNTGNEQNVDRYGSGSGRQLDGSNQKGVYCRDIALNCTRSMHQTVLVTGLDTTTKTITISDPLYHDYTLSPQVTVLANTVRGIGLEDFQLEAASNGAKFGFEYDNTYGSWLKGVETDRIVSYPVYTYNSAHLEFRDNYFHDLYAGERYTIDRAYGIETFRTSASLFENNLFVRMRVAIFIDHGSAGNVVGYNYVTEQRNDDAPDFLTESFTTNHGAHTIYNLFEGNVAPKFQSDYYYGSSGYTTLFRNNFTGYKTPWAIGIDRFNLYYSVIGNILGDSSNSGKKYQFDLQNTPSGSAYFRLGYPMIGNNSMEGSSAEGASTADGERLKYGTRVKTTLIRGGNYDFTTKKPLWSDDGAPSDGSEYLSKQEIPVSLYKTTKPSWFTVSTSVWPPIEPKTGTINDLPAKKCYASGVFNADTCYGN